MMKSINKLSARCAFAFAAVLIICCRASAAETPLKPKIVPPQKDTAIVLDKSEWREIGKIKNLPSKDIRGSMFGIGFECLDRKIFDPDKTYDLIAQTGLKWARCQTGWNRCETEKGRYDFKWLDDVVDNLRARGIEPWFNVGFGNPLYMDNIPNPTAVGCVPIYYGEECLNAWKNYVAALAEHFKGRVKFYEIWNEPCINQFWQPKKSDAALYADFVNLTAKIILKANPDAVCGACVSGQMKPFIRDFLKAGGAERISFFAIHPYAILPEDEANASTRGFSALLRDFAGGKKISLWQGETGFASYYPAGHWMKTLTQSNEAMQAKWMLRRYLTDMSEGRGLSSLFQAVDLSDNYSMGKGAYPKFGHYGLIKNKTYEPKLAFNVVKNLTAIFDSDTAAKDYFGALDLRNSSRPEKAGESRAFENGARVLTFERNGYPMYAYYLAEDVQLQMPQAWAGLKFLEGKNEIKRPVLLDLFSGKVYEYTGKIVKNVNAQNIAKAPLLDYPLVFSDLDAVKDRVILTAE